MSILNKGTDAVAELAPDHDYLSRLDESVRAAITATASAHGRVLGQATRAIEVLA